MAQKTKKVKTKTDSATTKKTTSKIKVAPPIQPNHISMVVQEHELEALVNLLQFSKKAFRILADKAAGEGDFESHKTLQAHSLISDALHEKFQTFFSIGEPVSRDFH